MKKALYLGLAIITAMILVSASFASLIRIEPEWLPVVIIVLAFPVCILSLFLWWNASNIEGDFPFTGY